MKRETELTREQMQQRIDRLTDCLNHAVSELSRAAFSEDFDGDDCMACIERIKDELLPMGKTSDWHILSDCYDRLCAACGLDNGDEIDILSIVEKRLRSVAGDGVVVPRDFNEWWKEYAPTVYHAMTYPRNGWMVDVARDAYKAGSKAAPASGWVSVPIPERAKSLQLPIDAEIETDEAIYRRRPSDSQWFKFDKPKLPPLPPAPEEK